MPKLFDDIILLVDCPVLGPPSGPDAFRIMPRGSHGVLVHQNESHPQIWIIEFFVPNSKDMNLVETHESTFCVRDRDRPPG